MCLQREDMLANEKEFDRRLERIGELYERGKDELNNISFGLLPADEQKSHARMFGILSELRDIAAMGLKANHEISSQ